MVYQPTVNLRLNDIIEVGKYFVDFNCYENFEQFQNNPDIQKIMYDLVIEHYRWAYLNADNKEQFVAWFNTYWKTHIFKYLPLFLKQISLSQELYTARLEEHEFDKTNTETPNLTTTTEYQLGDTVTLEHGRILTHERDLTENGENAEYEVQVTDLDRKLGGSETNKYTGADTTSRTGKNTDTRTENGNRTVTINDTGKNTVTIYDTDKFRMISSQTDVILKFIDEFSPLFVSILYAL